ncbi:TYRO protein tyrosine kinase-binding protein isoform X2 [Pseudophryne corroboree]|uniref:TYRO protein tyrosine kinase-binding protein isoform X2 n=1 Tax=Pseudophryne corroboree TaxID=495146 RepID=UPI0030814373
MIWGFPISIMVLGLSIIGAALGQEGCENCLQLNSGALIGIVICDIIFTMLIAAMAYCVSSKIQAKKYQEKLDKQKNNAPGNEPTYEQLHGQRNDIYNQLNTLQLS